MSLSRVSSWAMVVCALGALGCETQFKDAESGLGTAGSSALAAGAAAGVAGTAAMAGASASGTSGGVSAGNGTSGTGAPIAGAAGTAGTAAGSGASGTGATAGMQAQAGMMAIAGMPAAGSGAAGDSMPPPMQSCEGKTLAAGETTEMVMAAGRARTYILHVPASYSGQTPAPLVLDFHGILMSAQVERSLSGWDAVSDREGFILVYPQGTDTAFNVGICCTSSTTVDDVAFARAIVAQVSERGCVDPKRVHSVGYSMGGGMAMKLACEAADMFASISFGAFDLMPEVDFPCAPSRPIATLAFRSTGDPIVPYAGANDTIPPNGNPNLVDFIGAEANLQKWGMINGCTGAPVDMGGGCQYFTTCAAGVEVGLCTKQGGGHDWMDPSVGWEFLKRHPMP